jgi:hypothetical protein
MFELKRTRRPLDGRAFSSLQLTFHALSCVPPQSFSHALVDLVLLLFTVFVALPRSPRTRIHSMFKICGR